jgi:hypothetical protein
MSDDEPTLTIIDRMTRAGITEQRARDHLEAGRVRLNGDVVSDPATPTPPGTRPVVAGQ